MNAHDFINAVESGNWLALDRKFRKQKPTANGYSGYIQSLDEIVIIGMCDNTYYRATVSENRISVTTPYNGNEGMPADSFLTKLESPLSEIINSIHWEVTSLSNGNALFERY